MYTLEEILPILFGATIFVLGLSHFLRVVVELARMASTSIRKGVVALVQIWVIERNAWRDAQEEIAGILDPKPFATRRRRRTRRYRGMKAVAVLPHS